MFPLLSTSSTTPLRNPGAAGAKVTVTVQGLPWVMVPVQVVLASVKSRLGAPSVSTSGVPSVPVMGAVNGMISLCVWPTLTGP